MSNPKGRTVPDTLTMYLVIFVLYCLDIFFLQSDRSVLGDALYSRLAGLLVLFGYIWITKDSVSLLGISPKKKKLAAGAVYGTLFSVVPLFIVIAAEAIYLGITDITALDLQFSPPSMKFVRDIENLTPAAAVLIYIFTSFVGSLLKEFTFRGYILKKLKKVTNFRTANIIQALLYMFMTMPMLIRNQVLGYYDSTTSSVIVFIVFFYIVHETIAGIKWGLLTRVTGSTYVAVVDHFLFVFLANSIFITNRYVTWSFMTHMLAVQVISFIFAFIYYKINIKNIKEKESKDEKSKKSADSKAEKEAEKKEAVDEKLKEINEISPDQYKAIVDETNAKRKSHRHRHSDEYIRQRNEANSAKNEGLLENVSTSDAAKAASQYLNSNLNSSHHHSTHSHSHSHSHSSGRELESFSADEVAAKTGEYSDSLSLERKTPKHPHPHDTIARDSRLSAEELDKANAGKVAGLDETDIDDFLKNFNEDMSKPSHHHHHHHHHSYESVSEIETEDVSENFDADKFLEDFQRKEEHRHSSEHSSHSHSSGSPSHHHHSSQHKRNDEVVSMTEVPTDKFFDEYRKTVEEKKEKKKQSVIQRMRELGKLDDSESNDLI